MRITTITQGGLELNGSVRLNLDPFRFSSRPRNVSFPSDDGLSDIFRQVGLWSQIEEVGGLDASMAKLKLSSGQKQLFQIARAILHKRMMESKILLIDEGTSSMDADTEEVVTQLITTAFADCTKVFVGHRRALLANANVVLHLSHSEDPTVTRFRDRSESGGYDGDRERLWQHLS